MFIENANDESEYNDNFPFDKISAWDNAQDESVEDYRYEFADAIYSVIQGIIDRETLNEEFTSTNNAMARFKRHCMRNRNVRSRRSSVVYDFNNFDDYITHEDNISNAMLDIKGDSKMYINDLTDVERTQDAFRKFFEGGQCMVFGLGCGFTNDSGLVRICLHSFATNVTTNYTQNTIDFMIQSPSGKTVTLYPVDANYLESKLNHELKRIDSWGDKSLQINH